MTTNFLGLFTQAGPLSKLNAETTAAKSARVAGLVQDGYRRWFDGVTASVNDAGRLATELGKVRTPADLAALHRDWLNTTQARVTEGVQSFLDVSAKIAAEVSVVPLAVKPAAPAPVAAPVVAPVAVKLEAPVVAPAPEPVAAPVAPVVEEAPAPVVAEAVAPEAPAVVAEPAPVEAVVEAAPEAPVEAPAEVVAETPAETAPEAAPAPLNAPLAAPLAKEFVKGAQRRTGGKMPTTKSAAKAASRFE